MKILVFAHSGCAGGAEHGLRRLVTLLVGRHEVNVALPDMEGSEAAFYAAIGVPCRQLAIATALMNFPAALISCACTDLEQVAHDLRPCGFDLAISNTLAVLHGGLLARMLGIPHLTYAHECPADRALMPMALSWPRYLAMAQELSAKVIACSEFVAHQFSQDKRADPAVLEPFDYALASVPRHPAVDAPFVIQVIGVQSLRKNLAFAVDVTHALKLRGHEVRLDIIGQPGSGSAKLHRALAQRRIEHRLLPHTAQPYALNADERTVTLVCTACETYGLTIPESLRHGVPVLATSAGGPVSLLPDDCLYPPLDLDACVRRMEGLLCRYDAHVRAARQLYASLRSRASVTGCEDKLDSLFATLRCESSDGVEPTLVTMVRHTQAAMRTPVDPGMLAAAAFQMNMAMGSSRAAATDVRMLHRSAVALAVELAATVDSAQRYHALAFMIAALTDLQARRAQPLRILVWGDGLGIEAIRLANAQFHVDYLEHGAAPPGLARQNIDAARGAASGSLSLQVVDRPEGTYDALVLLPHAAPVAPAFEFLSMLASHAGVDGLVFLSEGWTGAEPFWPADLHSTEQFVQSLPVMLHSHFRLIGVNHAPYGKPFMFRKCDAAELPGAAELLADPAVLMHVLGGDVDHDF